MKDLDGAERGLCLHCKAEGLECCEFLVQTELEGEDDDDEVMNVPEEVYRHRPLLPSFQARLASSWNPVLETIGVCGNCGCAATEHEVTPIDAEEGRILDVARRLFHPFDLRLCIKQSYKDTVCLGLERDGFTYGEVGLLSFLRLLDHVKLIREKESGPEAGSTGVFYDLGCGVGKALVLAALKGGFDRCIGVELLPGLAAAARVLSEHLCRESMEVAPVEIIEGDMEKVPLENASLVLLNAGSWQEPSLSRLRSKLSQVLPDGCVVMTIRYPLAKAGIGSLELVEDLWLPMSWGEARVYLAQQRSSQAKQCCLNLHEMD